MKTMKDWINSDIDSFDIFFLPGDSWRRCS